mmetsp:Transcript_55365/g.142541  ORF Transcript_55365/g.142541 Transcript_55365/m.142541 type:complete len:290 (+) Transcript_55365:152-1021(+)
MMGIARLRAQGARNRSCAFLGVLNALGFASLGFSACTRPLTGPSRPALARPTAGRAFGVRMGASDLEGPHDAERFLLESLDLTPAEVAKVFRVRPGLERRTAESLRTSVQWLRGLGIVDADVSRMLRQNPNLFDNHPEKRDGMVKWLKEFGLCELEINKLVYRHVSLFFTSRDNAEATARWLTALGLDKSSLRDILERAPSLFGLKAARLEAKFSWLQGFGFSDAHIVRLIRKSPAMLDRSLDKNLKPRFALPEQQVSAGKLVDFVTTRASTWLFCKMADCSDRIQSSL